ncbi:MAG: ABC transporter substrate-binding protein [Clostridia bacterium]|nr:ABC transporter substrate-binding protein [Clostridia bacterium]
MKKLMSKLTALALVLVLVLSMGSVSLAEGTDKVVNIAVTGTMTSMNPLLMDFTEVGKYTQSLAFLPLVEMNGDLEFEGMLAESISTEDNLTFTIKLRDEAVWSDGTPVTTADVMYTFLCMASPEAGNPSMNMYSIIGVGDDGVTESGATEIEGIKVIDEKTMTVTTKWPMALDTFRNNIGRYMLILPEHVLGDIPMSEMQTNEWFLKPTVVSGPYFIEDYDLNHYVHYVANENYFMGAPKIKYLNVNVVQAAQLLAGLQSGEIDLIQQTTGDILLDDYESVKAMANVTVYPGKPITNQSIFFNVNNVPDVRIRQAFFYGLDRETILSQLVKGNGELVDAFLCSASPYYSAELGVTEYDPEKAMKLIAEAKADGADTKLTWHVNSGDATFVQAATFAAAMFYELGLEIEIKTVDLSTLMTVANGDEAEILSVQYTYAPADPYTDMSWMLSEYGWTRYVDEEVTAALLESQNMTDMDAIREKYLFVNKKVQEEVPMISAYIISTIGVTSNRLVNAQPDVFGTFINVHEWDIAG